MSSDAEPDLHPEYLAEKPPVFIITLYYTVTNILATFGWFLLAGFVICFYIWHNFLAGWYNVWKTRREDQEYAAKYHKNPDLTLAREEQRENARRRMQEESDRKAAEFAERQKEREEARKQEKAAEVARLLGETSGRRLKDGVNPEASGNSDKKPSFKPEYNPLTGSSGSGGYRAPKRGGCPGGSCNR